jgi:hypothetical protein
MMKHHDEKVFDRRERRVRGLWLRNGIYYAQIRLDDSDIATRVPLHGAQTVPQALTAMQEVKAKRIEANWSWARRRKSRSRPDVKFPKVTAFEGLMISTNPRRRAK